jgi:hypothetical protein
MSALIGLQISVAILIAVVTNQVCPPTGWRGIVPLKSTRADVERILGPPTDKSGLAYLSDRSVVVQYSVRPCDSDWNVPPETVIALGIRAEPMIPLADLHLDLTKYKKVRGDADVSDHFYYADEERGFAISVRDGMINRYIYEPTAKDKSRRCPNNPRE